MRKKKKIRRKNEEGKESLGQKKKIRMRAEEKLGLRVRDSVKRERRYPWCHGYHQLPGNSKMFSSTWCFLYILMNNGMYIVLLLFKVSFN